MMILMTVSFDQNESLFEGVGSCLRVAYALTEGVPKCFFVPLLLEVGAWPWEEVDGLAQVEALARVEVPLCLAEPVPDVLHVVVAQVTRPVAEPIVPQLQLRRPLVEPVLRRSRRHLGAGLLVNRWVGGGLCVLGDRLLGPECDFLDLPAEVEEEELWLFELSEYLFGLVDLVLEVDAAVVEAVRVVHAGVLKHVAQGARRVVPQQLPRVLLTQFYFHHYYTSPHPVYQLNPSEVILHLHLHCSANRPIQPSSASSVLLLSCVALSAISAGSCFRCYNITVRKMINEITINSNNAIEMSRGELLSWVNELLKTNLTKIEQLGTGAIYCQLIDVLYPAKIPLAKVNWKAKFDYEFVSNFKILQQSFTKLGILKNIEVEKLVKCKYQDNLEFLQWFKKIFDSNGNTGTNYNPTLRRGENELLFDRRQKENRTSLLSNSGKDIALSSSKNALDFTDRSALGCASFQMSDRDDTQQLKLPFSSIKPSNSSSISVNPPNSPQPSLKILDSPWRDELKQRSLAEEKEFYLRKFKEIEHLMEEWNTERTSGELIDRIRRIILVAPTVEWTVAEGEYCESSQHSD